MPLIGAVCCCFLLIAATSYYLLLLCAAIYCCCLLPFDAAGCSWLLLALLLLGLGAEIGPVVTDTSMY